jgi:PAS domain S-box-containing protein
MLLLSCVAGRNVVAENTGSWRVVRDADDPDRETKPAQPMPAELQPKQYADRALELLASIVDSSDDAIVTKDLDGIITSWNRGAERLFGYTADEAIGEPVTMLIPADRQDEEPVILARIRNGERIEHYEAIRKRKNGTLVPISLTVSPLRDAKGGIVGASKIARDISERYRAHEQQQLLLREMAHRVKNIFSLAGSLITLCARHADTPAQLAEMARMRLSALAKAYDLTVPRSNEQDHTERKTTTFHTLLRSLLSPYLQDGHGRLTISGDDLKVAPNMVTPIALLLNELVTNAVKHGALAEPSGIVSFKCSREHDHLTLLWTERGGRPITSRPAREGFGTQLSRITVEHQLGGQIERQWDRAGLTATITLNANHLDR